MSSTDTTVHRLLPAAELAEGELRRCPRAGGAVLLCRVNGDIHALGDRCPHEDVSLSLGSLAGNRLRCPLHGSEFDVRTGAVLSEPCETNLPRFDVATDEEGWVTINRVAEP